MGIRESLLAMALARILGTYVKQHDLGFISGTDGTMEILSGLVRMPDVAFISWERFPSGRVPDDVVLHLAPDLAVEVLGAGNTAKEMERKRREYFEAGVRLVWIINPKERNALVYTSNDAGTLLDENSVLSGGRVIPGFELRLSELFAELNRKND